MGIDLAPNQRVRCPNCEAATSLWQEITISGWRSLNEKLEPTGEREADWDFVEEGSIHGCGECGWRGMRNDLITSLGIDGQPLPVIHPAQLQIDE